MAMIAKNTLYNAVVGASQRIQQRRGRKGKRRLVARDMAAVSRRAGGAFRRTGGLKRGKGGIRGLVVANSTAIQTAVTAGLSGLQPSIGQTRTESGTEMVYEVMQPNSGLLQFEQIINPCDPGLFPGLTATASQYQRFRTNALSITYIPTSATSTSGTVYMAFVADPTFVAPTTLQGILQLQNVQTSAVYGKPLTIQVPTQSLQQAYNIQNVEKPVDASDQEAVICTGKLLVYLNGTPSADPADTVYGNITISYSYTFSSKQLTQGSNVVKGGVELAHNGAAGLYMVQWNYYKMFENHFQSSEILVPRMPGADHIVYAYCESVTGAGADVPSFETSNDGTTFTAVVPVHLEAYATGQAGLWLMPAAKYWRVRSTPLHADVDFYIHASSTCSDGRSNDLWTVYP